MAVQPDCLRGEGFEGTGRDGGTGFACSALEISCNKWEYRGGAELRVSAEKSGVMDEAVMCGDCAREHQLCITLSEHDVRFSSGQQFFSAIAHDVSRRQARQHSRG